MQGRFDTIFIIKNAQPSTKSKTFDQKHRYCRVQKSVKCRYRAWGRHDRHKALITKCWRVQPTNEYPLTVSN